MSDGRSLAEQLLMRARIDAQVKASEQELRERRRRQLITEAVRFALLQANPSDPTRPH